jgi:Xaa-Pro aminopeptidase
MSISPPDPYFQTTFAAAEFRRRRQDLCASIGDGVALLQGLPETGAFSLFRQHNDFFYLSGVESPHAYLTIDGSTGRTTLYLLPGDAKTAAADGPELNSDDAATALRLTEVDEVRPSTALLSDLPRGRAIYMTHAAAEGRQACQDTLRHAAARAALDTARCSQPAEVALAEHVRIHCGGEVRDLSPILATKRLAKSEAELSVMRRAGELTAAAIEEAMRATAPGVYEYQLAAIADFVFLAGGAVGGGYRPIVAGGSNIWNMHYYRNNCRLAAGDLVLMDYAPDLDNYTSDIGRMWPVDGKYSRVQRDLYGFVVDYHRTLLEVIGPGELVTDLCRRAAEKMRPLATRTNWGKPVYADAVERLLATGQPFTHPVGMAVHDVGAYRDAPLAPGLVFALDPQLWVPEEKMYIRVEDTVAVLAHGVENLTAGATHDLDQVERLIGSHGLLEALLPAPELHQLSRRSRILTNIDS